MALQARQETLEQIFKSELHYSVPIFQRPYSWGPEQTTQLVDDLTNAWRNQEMNYFLGSLVLVAAPEVHHVDVIDGQQRLTTLNLLLAVARDFVDDENKRLELQGYLAIPPSLIQGKSGGPRLRVRDQDQEFFDSYIIDSEVSNLRDLSSADLATGSQRNLQANTEAIIEALETEIHEGSLWDFIRFTLRNVHLVLVETDDFHTAHKVFGVLNTRGLPLNASDVFKARILGSIPAEARDGYAQRWDEGLQPIEQDPDPFFHNLLSVLTQRSLKQSVADGFSTNVLDQRLTEDNGTELLDNIIFPYLSAYLESTTSPERSEQPTEQYLAILQSYRAKDWVPVAMWAHVNVPSQELRALVLKQAERFMGPLTLIRESASRRERLFNNALSDLQSHSQVTAALINEAFTLPDDVIHKAMLALRGEIPGPLRTLLLHRAHYAATERLGIGARRTACAPLVPTHAKHGISPHLDPDYWGNRLGGLILVLGTRSALVKKDSWSQMLRYLDQVAPDVRSEAVSAPPVYELTMEALDRRQKNLVDLLAYAWEITEDSAGIALASLTDEKLLNLSGAGRASLSSRITLQDVVHSGLLAPGTTLVWHRPRIGDTFHVQVSEEGNLRCEDGYEATSPSAAAIHLTGSNTQALDAWKRVSDDTPLREIWAVYRTRILRA